VNNIKALRAGHVDSKTSVVGCCGSTMEGHEGCEQDSGGWIQILRICSELLGTK